MSQSNVHRSHFLIIRWGLGFLSQENRIWFSDSKDESIFWAQKLDQICRSYTFLNVTNKFWWWFLWFGKTITRAQKCDLQKVTKHTSPTNIFFSFGPIKLPVVANMFVSDCTHLFMTRYNTSKGQRPFDRDCIKVRQLSTPSANACFLTCRRNQVLSCLSTQAFGWSRCSWHWLQTKPCTKNPRQPWTRPCTLVCNRFAK